MLKSESWKLERLYSSTFALPIMSKWKLLLLKLVKQTLAKILNHHFPHQLLSSPSSLSFPFESYKEDRLFSPKGGR
jgi:hypothetical protein